MFDTYRKILATAGIVLCLFSSAFAYSGGSGTEADPYQIEVVSDWNDLMNTTADWDKYFIMTADVNLQGIPLTPVSNSTNKFTGVFDGGGHIIRNAVINENKPGASYIGLFGSVGPDGEVRNLGVENVYSDGYGNIGGLAGGNDGTIIACYVTGIVSGVLDNGGLVGANYGTITNCYATSAVNGGLYRGGGGLVGNNCEGTIANCYATGAVTGARGIGGLVGVNNGGTIVACYATGAVSGDSDTGGLAGYNDAGRIGVSFWDVNTSGWSTSAGGGEGKTTTEMKTLSTFTSAGWDFVGETANGTKDIWTICEGVNYPKFVWQNQPPIADAGADQTVYAWIDGVAEVDLDGWGSSDADECNGLTYYWSWVIDGNTYEANGVNPTIELPVGVHTIGLIVNDGLADSAIDDVNITVIAPLKSVVRITPRIINRCSRQQYIFAFVRMPEGIMKKDISNEPLILYPGEIEASRQWIVSVPCGFGRHRKWLVGILAFFDKSDVLDAIPANGRVKLEVAGELVSGRCFYGSDTVIIIGPRRPWHFPKK